MQGAVRVRLRRIEAATGRDPADAAGATDAALAARALLDREAFAALYARYVEPVYRYCYHLLGDREAAEDATSQVFLQALAALPRYRDQGSFRSWLFAIAHNVATDLARRSRRAAARGNGRLTEDVIDPAPSPEDAALAAQTADSNQALLAALPADQRRVLELRLSGLTSPEAARVLGRSPTAIRSLQFRAVERLRQLVTTAEAAVPSLSRRRTTMASAERGEAELDAALDALIAGRDAAPGTIAEEDLTALRRLRNEWLRPAPDPAFVRRLGSDLAAFHRPAVVTGTPASAGQSTRATGGAGARWPESWAAPGRSWRLPVAFAALAICAVLVAVALVRGDDGRRETIPAGTVASPPAANRAVLLVIDVSGSMSYDPLGGEPKLVAAKEAARAVLDALPDGAEFGLLAFNDQQTWAVPVAPLAGEGDRERARQAIDALEADGGTELYPALALGLEALRLSTAADRQMVVLTDGRSRTGTPDDHYTLVAPAGDEVTIHAVWVLDDIDTTVLRVITTSSGGRLVLAASTEQIPVAVLDALGLSPATPPPSEASPIPAIRASRSVLGRIASRA